MPIGNAVALDRSQSLKLGQPGELSTNAHDCPRRDGFDRLNVDGATLLCDPQIVGLLQIQPKLRS